MSTQAAPLIPEPPVTLMRALVRLMWFATRFAFYGPLYGSLVLWFLSTVVLFPWNAGRMGTEQAFAVIFQSFFGFFLLIIPVAVAYVLTAIPAALTGLVAGALSLATPRPLIYYAGTALAGWFSIFAAFQTSPHSSWQSAAGWGCIGAAAALISAWRSRRGMWRNPKIYGIPVTL